jgi:hypothetical protein
MWDGVHGILVQHNDNPIVYASRIGLARSSGVGGIASLGVAGVRVADAARPHGVLAEPDRLPGGDLQVFITPVRSSAVTVTALDQAGHQLATAIVPAG